MAKEIKGDLIVRRDLNLSDKDASRALIIDGSNNIESSATTDTELGYLSGVTSSIQDQLDDSNTEIGHLVTLSGVPSGSDDLGTFTGTTIPDGSTNKEALQSLEDAIEAIPSPMSYRGLWAASTNTPTLADGAGVNGYLYQVTDDGTVDFGTGPISFQAGDKVVYNGATATWEKWDQTDAVASVNGQLGVVVLDTDDINEGSTNKYYSETLFDASLATKDTSDLAEGSNLYFTDERAQDAVGTILGNTASVELTYTDGTPEITADVLPGGVDHDQLLNYVANEHVDHSAVQIATTANTSGLTGGGDITATRNLSVDINGTTTLSGDIAETDALLIYDDSSAALRRVSRQNFLNLIPRSSVADFNERSFSGANNQAVPADVTGFNFLTSEARSFEAQVSVFVNATTDLFEVFTVRGIQKGADWDISQTSTGDDTNILFSITSLGQVQYMSDNYTGFTSLTMKFRANTTSV